MYMYTYMYEFTCLSICLSAACLSVCLPACLPACLPVCLSVLCSVSPALCLCVCLFVSANTPNSQLQFIKSLTLNPKPHTLNPSSIPQAWSPKPHNDQVLQASPQSRKTLPRKA